MLRSIDSDLERAVAVMYSPHLPYHKKPTPPAPVERPLQPDFSYVTNPWIASAPLPPQTSPRARALAEVICAPSPPLPESEDTPMEDITAAPDLVALPPEEPTSEPGSPIAPWAPSLDDTSTQRDVAYICQVFPGTSDEFILCALEEGEGDPTATIAWAVAINNADKVLGVISKAFPTATPKEVKDTLLSKNGNATATYTLLTRRHKSAWDREHFALSSQIARKLIAVNSKTAPEFCDPDPSYIRHEAKWWDTMVATKAYKVADSALDTSNWSAVTLLAASTVDIGPRVTGYVESLGAWHTDKTAFKRVMKALRTFHNFGSLTRHCTVNPESTGSALRIVLALLEDGLASPGAAAWAMEHLTKAPQAYRAARFHYAAYSVNRCTLWNRRNQSLAA